MKKTIIALLILGMSCSFHKKETTVETKTPFRMKIERPDFSSLQPLKLSEFADSIEYIQLETTTDCLLPYYGGSMEIDSSLLFVSTGFGIYSFDHFTGQFLRQIGRKGQGPGEHADVSSYAIDRINQKIFMLTGSNEGIMTYDYAGNYLGDIKDSLIVSCFGAVSLLHVCDNSVLLSTNFTPKEHQWGCKPYQLVLYDYENKKVLQFIPNQMECDEYNPLIYNTMNPGMSVFTKQDDSFFYKAFYNDTLYQINKNTVMPYVIIDLGKRKYPERLLYSPNYVEESSGKIMILNALIHADFILLDCYCIGDKWGFICKYDTKGETLTYHSNLLINDIDGGNNIPIQNILSGIGCVTPYNERDDVDEKLIFSTLNKSEIKYPELKDKFENMQHHRDPDDNPLLMKLYKKNYR